MPDMSCYLQTESRTQKFPFTGQSFTDQRLSEVHSSSNVGWNRKLCDNGEYSLIIK